jgi:hypothetical protein
MRLFSKMVQKSLKGHEKPCISMKGGNVFSGFNDSAFVK